MIALKKLDWFTLAGVILLLAVAWMLIIEPFLNVVVFEDFNYHLLAAQGFDQAGGIVTWDFWESLPQGRAHVYPPLFHLILSFFVKVGFNPLTLAYLIPFISIVGSLALSWFGLKLLFNSRMAFFALLALTSFIGFVVFSGVIIPAALVLAAAPLLIFLIKNQKVVGATILLTMMLYTHMIMPIFILITIIIWLASNHQLIKTGLKIILIALLLYAPWAIHIINNLVHIKYLNADFSTVTITEEINLNISIVILFILSLIYIIWFGAKEFKAKILFFVALAAVQLPLLLTLHPNRFFISGGFFAICITIAYVLDSILKSWPDKKTPIIISVVVLLGLQVFFFQLWISPKNNSISTQIIPGFFPRAIEIKTSGPGDILKLTQNRYTKPNLEIIEIIKNNSQPNEAIYATANIINNTKYLDHTVYLIGQFFAAQSQRPMINRRNPEFFWLEPPNLNQIGIIIADLNQLEQLNQQLDEKFQTVGQINNLAVIKNNSPDVITAVPTKPIINQWLALIIVLAAVGLVVLDTKKTLITR